MDEERYREEQIGELEALNSIYVEEIEILGEDPHCFKIPVEASDGFDDEEIKVVACMQFTFTKTYPDEIPLIEVAESSGIEENDERELVNHLREEGSNNTGMAMIFTLVSETQDFLSKIIERIKKYKEEEKEKAEVERLKEEEKKYHGTQVTVESFTKWRINFENEMKEKAGKKVKEEIDAKKLTGRQLFESDSSLIFSDAQFYGEGTNEGVHVDESLFQELDDLELDDDDDDDDDD